jgi:hypothetical protein
MRNVYSVENPSNNGGRDSEPVPEKTILQQAVTDGEGQARLPPLRQGHLELRAAAEGYRDLMEPVHAEILDEETSQTFQVFLEPLGERITLHLKRPDGQPAAGAEVLLMENLETGRGLFSTRTDTDGSALIPRQPAGALLLGKHPDAAFLIREWRPSDNDTELTWDLRPASERNLALKLTDKWGAEAAARAELALWIEGKRLVGRTLAWLTNSRPLADSNGFWIGTNLPRTGVSVVAWSPTLRPDAQRGELDALATEVAFPWPETVEIQIVH